MFEHDHPQPSSRQAAQDRLLANLNPMQAEAVRHLDGPLLILAGAGSGKTRVITHRVAWLVEQEGVSPAAILAITFTNKAANEMKQRIGRLIGPVSQAMWIGTFHAMMVRILRRFADRLGYQRNFAILDVDDQHKLVKQCIENLNLDDRAFAFRNVHSQISSAKNALIDPDDFARRAGRDHHKERVAAVYRCYQDRLKQNNCMDFDDILVQAVHLLRSYPAILAEYQARFRYILVDEYQDTNEAQYAIIRLLSQKHKNLCVVGDDDQSIYRFRGANIQNILNFEHDFKACRVIKLEQNYRSTGHILKAANAVIVHNDGRKAKALWTEQGDGDKLTFFRADNQHEEGRYIAGEINRQVARLGQKHFGDFAVLYRLNALSRSVEQALREQGIPYRIYGGTRFYDRKEIKDVLAYLRLVLVPTDDLSLTRIINTPRRGIGQVTLDTLAALALRDGLPMEAVCAQADRYPDLQRAAPRLKQFAQLMADMRDELARNERRLDQYIDWVETQSGLIQDLLDQQNRLGREDVVDRIENLQELLSDAVEFDGQIRDLPAEWVDPISHPEETLLPTEDLSGLLEAFLERAALYSDLDQDESEDNLVRLMTIHSAKGLEFDTVFLIGVEEGLFPGYRSMGNREDYEEERRLAYVAMTRARKKLYLTATRTRLIFGQTQRFPVSSLAREIPAEHLEEVGGSREGDGLQASRTVQAGFQAERERFSRKPKAAQTDPAAVSLKAGDRVRHPKFGPGTVVTADPVAGDAILLVDFQKAGRKRMLARHSQLVPD